MKVLFIKKKYIYYLFIFLLSVIVFYFSTVKNNNKSLYSFNPIDKNSFADINCDGIKDNINISHNNIIVDINNEKYILKNYIENNSISHSTESWPVKVFLFNISRSNKPEIIIQNKNKDKASVSILSYTNENFINLYSESKNIFGILDSKSGKNPRCFALNSYIGINSLNSFMIINNKVLDITEDSKDIPGLSNILEFINLIEKNYEIDDTPNIFTENIPSKELGILWNLDKENFNYSFQDCFFIDNTYDTEGNITSLTWRFTFEVLNKTNDYKKEFIIYLTSEISYDKTYKISSIYTS